MVTLLYLCDALFCSYLVRSEPDNGDEEGKLELGSLIKDDMNLPGTSNLAASVHQQSLLAPPNASDELRAADIADNMKCQKSSLKFSRPEDKGEYKEEWKPIQGTKIICSVDRVLDLLTVFGIFQAIN